MLGLLLFVDGVFGEPKGPRIDFSKFDRIFLNLDCGDDGVLRVFVL